MSYFYLGSPYTHKNPKVRQRRYEAVRNFAGFLAKHGEWVFCPIMHSHDMAIHCDMPYTFEFWDDWNKALIRPSRGVIVFQIEGWDTSRGLKSEIDYAKQIGLPVIMSKEAWRSYDHSV